MSSSAVRANCLDASALVKLHVPESGSEVLRAYCAREPTKYATPFCFYEALNVLKVKLQYRKEISRDDYLRACFELVRGTAWSAERVNDLDFASPEVFADGKRLVERTSLDLSDAFQILSVKRGYFSPLSGESRTVLVTGDKDLAVAARSEGIRVWYFMDEPEP
jgi:predicted nucleic acid-binding protein